MLEGFTWLAVCIFTAAVVNRNLLVLAVTRHHKFISFTTRAVLKFSWENNIHQRRIQIYTETSVCSHPCTAVSLMRSHDLLLFKTPSGLIYCIDSSIQITFSLRLNSRIWMLLLQPQGGGLLQTALSSWVEMICARWIGGLGAVAWGREEHKINQRVRKIMKLNWERKGKDALKRVKGWEKLTEINSCCEPRATDGKLVGKKWARGWERFMHYWKFSVRLRHTAGLKGELHLLPSSLPLTHWLMRSATPTFKPSASWHRKEEFFLICCDKTNTCFYVLQS